MSWYRPLGLVAAAMAVGALAGGCARSSGTDRDGAPSLIVYSGRSESLIGPMLTKFGEENGVDLRVRYAGTSELAATLLEEGSRTPADVFISQDAAALGALSSAGMLRPLAPALLESVPAAFRSHRDDWVGLSARARVVVYNPERITEDELPRSLADVVEPAFRGRLGVAPANGSFQAHMAALRAIEGADALDRWLLALAANEPERYPNNRSIVDAVIAGEIDLGLVNHYYLWRALSEDPDASGRNYFQTEGPASGFVNVAGAGLLSDNAAGADLLAFLLSPEAQRYFSEETREYPLVAGVEAEAGLIPLEELAVSQVDFGELAENLEPALEAIARSGLLQ